MSLNILAILKALTIVVAPPTFKVVLIETNTLAIVISTIKKSNMFHPSLKNTPPSAIILIIVSRVKIAVKA